MSTAEKVTPAAAPSKTSKSSFRDFHEAAIKKEESAFVKADTTDDKAQDTQPAKENKQINVENKQQSGGQETKVKDENGLEKEKTTVSSAENSAINFLFNGIIGILEGFGLLNDETGNHMLPEEIQKMAAAAFAQNGQADTPEVEARTNADQKQAIQMFSELIARMPQTDQNTGLQAANMQEAQKQIAQLVSEYLSSFANVNNPGAEKNKSSNTTAVQANTEANASPKEIADKLLAMLNEAYAKKEASSQSDTARQQLPAANDEAKTAAADDISASQTRQTPASLNAMQKTDVLQEDAASQAAAKAPEASKAMQENAARIVDKISVMVREGKQEFDIALKPEHLGKLSIKLTMDSDGIKAHIKAADNAVKGLIADQIPALQETLKEKGIQLTHVEVTFEKPAYSHEQSQNRNFQGNESKKNSRYAVLATSGISYEMLMDATELLTPNSSIEFQA